MNRLGDTPEAQVFVTIVLDGGDSLKVPKDRVRMATGTDSRGVDNLPALPAVCGRPRENLGLLLPRWTKW